MHCRIQELENQSVNGNIYYQDIESTAGNLNLSRPMTMNHHSVYNQEYNNYNPPQANGLKYSFSKQLIQLGCIPKSVLLTLQSSEKSLIAQWLLKMDQMDYYVHVILRYIGYYSLHIMYKLFMCLCVYIGLSTILLSSDVYS